MGGGPAPGLNFDVLAGARRNRRGAVRRCKTGVGVKLLVEPPQVKRSGAAFPLSRHGETIDVTRRIGNRVVRTDYTGRFTHGHGDSGGARAGSTRAIGKAPGGVTVGKSGPHDQLSWRGGMRSFVVRTPGVRARGIEFIPDAWVVHLEDGRSLGPRWERTTRGSVVMTNRMAGGRG